LNVSIRRLAGVASEIWNASCHIGVKLTNKSERRDISLDLQETYQRSTWLGTKKTHRECCIVADNSVHGADDKVMRVILTKSESGLRAYSYLSHAQLRAEPCRVPCWEKIGPPPVLTNAQIIIAKPQLGAMTIGEN